MKHILSIALTLGAIMMNCMAGGFVADCVGVAPWVGAVTLNSVAAVSPLFMPEGALRAGLYQELWTGETIKAFRNSLESIGWLNRIRSFDSHVAKNNTIHFVDLGGDPEVLINNTTYPIDIVAITDADKAIGLDKYQTQATPITDDELKGLSYDKMATVIERHRLVVDEKKISKALHALAPADHAAKHPVLKTTGETVDGRKRLRVQDIIDLKAAFDKQKTPQQGRILVLNPDHVADLLAQDTTFAQRYNNHTTGAISNQYGFEIYEYVDCPLYTVSTKAKVNWGTTATSAMQMASVAFYAPRMMKATGETKAYIGEPEPTYQRWLYNLRHYFICLPLKNEAIGALISDLVS
jgi:hypothetical protein